MFVVAAGEVVVTVPLPAELKPKLSVHMGTGGDETLGEHDLIITYFVGGDVVVTTSKTRLPMRFWMGLYSALATLSVNPATTFGLPPQKTIEIGSQVFIP
jgi:K+ transporter